MEATEEEKKPVDFEEIYKKYFSSIAALCYSLTNNRQQGLDLAQDAFSRLWERWNATEYKERSTLSFLYITARNLCYDTIKAAHHQTQLLDEQINERISDDILFLDELIKQETLRHLKERISRLSKRKKEIIHLSLSGKNNIEIAEILRISVNTVKTLKKEAYAQLKIALKNDIYLCVLLLII